MQPGARRVDVFNGDGDGLCALQQLRLAERAEGPHENTGSGDSREGPEAGDSVLITGVKRDIRLLQRVPPAPGTLVTVLDISFDANRADVLRLLEAGCRVRYFDHHHPGEIPAHPRLETHIDTAPGLCTSLLVDRYLDGQYRPWAVAGAFADNLGAAARDAFRTTALSHSAAPSIGNEGAMQEGAMDEGGVQENIVQEDTVQENTVQEDTVQEDTIANLRELGELLNYNGYGEREEDLYFHPADLFRALHPYRDPLRFHREAPQVETLRRGLASDLGRVGEVTPAMDTEQGQVLLLPAESWARRVQGVWANRLAAGSPSRAFAVGLPNHDGSLRLSVRAPLERPGGAGELCAGFPGGGGRAGAGGINRLPPEDLPRFLDAFRKAFRKEGKM